MTVKAHIEDPKSSFYSGPKTDAPYILYIEARDKGFYIEFDTEENFPDALMKGGVNLFRALNSNAKTGPLRLVPPKPKPDHN